jgi:subtilase family serine protease
MNLNNSINSRASKLLGALGLFAITVSIPVLARAQDAPLSAAPENSVQLTEGIGGAGYAVPDDVYVPPSSVERPEDAGVLAHTTYVLKARAGNAITPSATLPNGETPASLECVYGIKGAYSSGCTKTTTGAETTSGWGTIALVDAYDNPDASSDYTTFSKEFGLPTTGFTKVYANGNGDCSTPAANAGWSVESSLDIEWAHAMAPAAKIILVEACSNSYTDLLYAETVAAGLVASTGGDISNSWASGEFSGETTYDSYFYYNQYPAVSDIVFFASADDAGCGAAYPSSSPWVVSAGGTTVNRLSTGKLNTTTPEACWSGSGGGTSAYETSTEANPYQYPIFGTAARATPDFAFDADPNSGVDVYSQYGSGGWLVVGGTSVSSPSLAGIVNSSANKLGSYFLPSVNPAGYFNNEEDILLYSQLPTQTAYNTNFYDITTGGNGCYVGKSWDYCTGVGSPRGYLGK